MKFYVIFGCIFLIFALASPLYGEIYSWTDAMGVMHFTNYHPPPQARLFVKDVRPPRHEAEVGQNLKVEPEQPAAERRDIQEDFEEKLEGAIRRIEEFERTLENTEVQNLGLERELLVANQKAEAALAYAEELEYKIREVRSPPYSDTVYLNSIYRYPIRYKYRHPVKIHKPRIRNNRFHIKRHSIGRHFNKSPKRFHHKTLTGRTHFSIPHGVGIQHKRQLGSRHVSKSRGFGVRSNARFSRRHSRR